jgi:hypothetical protein
MKDVALQERVARAQKFFFENSSCPVGANLFAQIWPNEFGPTVSSFGQHARKTWFLEMTPITKGENKQCMTAAIGEKSW